MMVLAYCSDLDRLRDNIELLYDQGMYTDYIKRFRQIDKTEKTVITGFNSKTKVQHINNDSESICYFEIDPDTGFDFIRDVGLTLLASGTNRGGDDDPYVKVHNDPSSFRIYEYFYPKIIPRDPDTGTQIGPAYFNKGVELARNG